jgi:hypothetical protein
MVLFDVFFSLSLEGASEKNRIKIHGFVLFIILATLREAAVAKIVWGSKKQDDREREKCEHSMEINSKLGKDG